MCGETGRKDGLYNDWLVIEVIEHIGSGSDCSANCVHRDGEDPTYHETLVEVRPQQIVHKFFGFLLLSAPCLILEDHIVIPSKHS